MSEMNGAISLCADLLSEIIRKKIEQKCAGKKSIKKRRLWVRQWIARRPQLGLSATFVQETRMEDPSTFKNHLRMTPAKFDELLALILPDIQKKDTKMREAIPAKLKLEIVLRFLASGDSYKSLESAYRVPVSTISKFMVPVLGSIASRLAEYIKVPNDASDWRQVSRGFASRWNFPNCCGAIDGKHIRIKCPPCSTSDFFNYKGFHSIVLFALVDSSYKFLYIDVGRNGRISDSTIFRESALKSSIEDGALQFPRWGVLLGDDAFPLTSYLMKPYSHHGPLTIEERIFNYRLSRARRVVENAFGILASRFRIFHRPIELNPEKVELVVRAACSIHNWLRCTDERIYFPVGSIDREDVDTGEILFGQWRNEISGDEFRSIRAQSGNYSRAAACLREKYKVHFATSGAVEWQDKFI